MTWWWNDGGMVSGGVVMEMVVEWQNDGGVVNGGGMVVLRESSVEW